jgi:surface carbohydrate biosynthesis protein
MKIALIVDHPRRDLGGLCLVACELVRRGHTVFLVPMYLNDEVFSILPDLVVLNYLRRPSRGLVSSLQACGIPVAVHSTEGGPINEVERYRHDLLLEEGITDRIEFYSFWGEKIASEARAGSWFPPEIIRTTGSPRFDLYHPDWRAASLELNPGAVYPSEPFVLICSNYGLSNSAFCDGEGAVRSLVQQHHYDEATVRGWLANEEIALREMIALVKSRAAALKDTKFVWRPHPFENVVTYQNAFAGVANVEVRQDGEIVGWMLRAHAAIQQFCTTSFDAWFAGVPSFRPAWIPAYIGVGDQNAVNLDCDSEAALSENLEAAVAGKFRYREDFAATAAQRIADWFHLGDGCAYQRLADCIEAVQPQVPLATRRKRVEKSTATTRGSGALRRFTDSALHRAGIMPTWNFANFRERLKLIKRYRESVKHFSVEDVRRIAGVLAAKSGGRFPMPRVCGGSQSEAYELGNKLAKSVVLAPM